ncbi:hypothetical protein [Vibrio sp. MEBiC08052]|uniref:hypothetical protein n=1 Tax=Vibrio sp. MEBiC08052 TaxID=1761910 RepID=UPI0012FB56E5|nr:hypothetical protein [Vibrio sp. MEBiC08052]
MAMRKTEIWQCNSGMMGMNCSKISQYVLIGISVWMIIFSAQALMGSLYGNVVHLGITRIDQSEHQMSDALVQLNQFKDGMLLWDDDNPENLSMAAYTALLNSFSAKGFEREQYLQQSDHYNWQSIRRRPLFPDGYTQETELLALWEKPFDEVIGVLNRAETFGPYEKYTAETAMNVLFKYWAQLSQQQRLNAVHYMTAHEKYGLKRWRLNEIFKVSPYKQQFCNLAVFVRLPLWTCGNLSDAVLDNSRYQEGI